MVPTDAIDGSALDHMPPVAGFVNDEVLPIHTEGVPPIGNGMLTVTVFVATQPVGAV